ncbi:MAG: Holliday junction branch migration protein RuvA [Acidimicrobiia bacterium]
MIGRLRGTLASVHPDGVLLDVGGVGYDVKMTPASMELLPVVGEEVVVHTHLHVREDVLELYGFSNEGDRSLFRILLSTSGVGPKLALATLGTLGGDGLRNAITTEDVEALCLVPGIGKRSAQKFVLELRPKLGAGDAELPAGPGSISEVREALEGLGYQPTEIRDVLASLPSEEPAEGLLRLALQELGRR